MPPTTAAPSWLPPIPGLERRAGHRYWLGDLEFPVSVTGVLSVLKSDYALNRIETSRAIWEPRGNQAHRALELFLLLDHSGRFGLADEAAEMVELIEGDHAHWIVPLIRHDRWRQVRVIASERATCCVRRGVAGTFDCAFLDDQLPIPQDRPEGVTGPARVLSDLKTLGHCTIRWRVAAIGDWSDLIETDHEVAEARIYAGAVQIRQTRSSTWRDLMPVSSCPWESLQEVELRVSKPSTYSTAAQLGGYMALEATHGNHYDYGQTIWCRPGQTVFSAPYSLQECRTAWAAAWATWRTRDREPPPF